MTWLPAVLMRLARNAACRRLLRQHARNLLVHAPALAGEVAVEVEQGAGMFVGDELDAALRDEVLPIPLHVRDAQFVGFPEFSLTGWVYEPSQMLTLQSRVLKEVGSWARKHRIHIATCFVEKRGGRTCNATAVFGPRGRIGIMRKVNLVSSGF